MVIFFSIMMMHRVTHTAIISGNTLLIAVPVRNTSNVLPAPYPIRIAIPDTRMYLIKALSDHKIAVIEVAEYATRIDRAAPRVPPYGTKSKKETRNVNN